MFKIKAEPNEIKPGDKVQVIRFDSLPNAHRVQVGTADMAPGFATANARGIFELNVDDEPLTLGVRPSGYGYGVVQVDILERAMPQLSEPSMRVVVVDKDGDIWRQKGGGWVPGDHTGNSSNTWEFVLEYGPVTVLAEPHHWDSNPYYRDEYLEYRLSL